MRREDFGIDPKTSRHDERLTRAESAFLGILWVDHADEENKIPADKLAIAYAQELGHYPDPPGNEDFLSRWKRQVRKMQNHLLMEHRNIPVFSSAGHGGGYWIGANEDEGKPFYDTFRQRGLTGLTKAARGKQAVLVEMVQELSFEFDSLEDKTGMPVVTIDGRPTPIAVVDAMISKMMANPEKFSADLRKLGRKFGSVLLPKTRAREIETAARRLQDLVTGLT